MKMTEEKNDEKLKFTSKNEVVNAISVLTPLALSDNKDYDFAIEKIKELTKLL